MMDVDHNMIRTYLDFLFEDAPRNQFILARTIPDVKNAQTKSIPAETVTRRVSARGTGGWLAEIAEDANRRKLGVFILPGTIEDEHIGNKHNNIGGFSNVCVDIDQGDPRHAYRRLHEMVGSKPTLTVLSGGKIDARTPKIHLYWGFEEWQDDPLAIGKARRLMAEHVGADQCFARETQIIRVPGTVHWKHDMPAMCEIVEV